MDRKAVLDRLDDERRQLAHEGEVLEVLQDVTRMRAVDGSHHGVIYAALTETNAEDVIAREVAHFRSLGVPFEWKLYAHDAPANLRDRLQQHGLTIGRHEAVLVFDLSELPGWVTDAGTIPVRRADDAAGVADYRTVAEAVFEKDYTFTATQLLDAIRVGSTEHRGYVGYATDGTPASIGRLYTHPDSAFGGLYGGGTVKPFRGQGYYRATLAARARDAMTLGAKCLIIDALPTSRPILEKLGFQHLTDTWPCEWAPANDTE